MSVGCWGVLTFRRGCFIVLTMRWWELDVYKNTSSRVAIEHITHTGHDKYRQSSERNQTCTWGGVAARHLIIMGQTGRLPKMGRRGNRVLGAWGRDGGFCIIWCEEEASGAGQGMESSADLLLQTLKGQSHIPTCPLIRDIVDSPGARGV